MDMSGEPLFLVNNAFAVLLGAADNKQSAE
jgi:hypothetical protein